MSGEQSQWCSPSETVWGSDTEDPTLIDIRRVQLGRLLRHDVPTLARMLLETQANLDQARRTTTRLNHRAQRAESELAKLRRSHR